MGLNTHFKPRYRANQLEPRFDPTNVSRAAETMIMAQIPNTAKLPYPRGPIPVKFPAIGSTNGLSHRFGQYYLSRIAYCVLRIAYCVLRIAYSPKGHPKHNIISVTFNDTVQDNIWRALAETMIMARRSTQLQQYSHNEQRELLVSAPRATTS